MKRLILATLACCVAGLAFGAEHDPSIDVRFPDQIGTLRFSSKHEFPGKGAGVNYGYQQDRPFIRAAVFVYTNGQAAIPTGTDSALVQKHFDQVIGAVQSMATTGQAKSVTLLPAPTQVTRLPGCGPQFLWRGYMIDLDGASTVKAYTYLTALGGHFIKLRITFQPNPPQDQRDVDLFVSEVRKVLGRCK